MMKFDVWMLCLLFVLKMVFVIPMVAVEHGLFFGGCAAVFACAGYGLMIWGSMSEARSTDVSLS